MNIAFTINRLALIGLGVTISSLIRNCSDSSRLSLWFLCAALTPKDKSYIKKMLDSESFLGKMNIVDFDPKAYFSSFCSLHGDWTTYGRLLLVDVISEDQVLYLDADLVVELDILEIENFDFGEFVLAGVGGGTFKYTLGNKFYIEKLGISPETEYFNAGVLLLNLKEWRIRKVKEECLNIAKQYPNELPSHDQSLLNIYSQGRFSKLPTAFNCEWLAYEKKQSVYSKAILHFIGSPKPWDPLACFIHNGYSTWKSYLNEKLESTFSFYTADYYRRIWKIRRSYLRTIRNRLNHSDVNSVVLISRLIYSIKATFTKVSRRQPVKD